VRGTAERIHDSSVQVGYDGDMSLRIMLQRCLVLLILPRICLAETWPGYVDSPFNREQVREIQFAEGSRAILVAPNDDNFDPKRPTVLIIFATPNGNTAEQTLGCQLTDGLDWHFDIQHVAAQWRLFQKHEVEHNTVLACVQAENLSWPAWKSERDYGPAYICQMVEALRATIPGQEVSVVLAAHSGGGSFVFGFIDGSQEIPNYIERIAFLDANYGFDAELHGKKLVNWLKNDSKRCCYVLAYDDREITLDGKKVVGPTGGTYRATNRMLDFLRPKENVEESAASEFKKYTALNNQFVALVHPNPTNIILHTRLVGEMNGLVDALTWGIPLHNTWGNLSPPRAYSELVQPQPFTTSAWRGMAPALPPRRSDAKPGSQIVKQLLDVDPAERERVIAQEILQGNIPKGWRKFVDIMINGEDASGSKHKVILRVSPDYLCVGNDDDFVRMPLTPYTAQLIADVAGCMLPTRKMVDEIHRAAKVKLSPQPLTEDRESLATFLLHHELIQKALNPKDRMPFISGVKKDVVISRKLSERPDRVAIYGWHQLNGEPIQPLTTVHVARYVDYSHGIRLVDQWCEVDGTPMRVSDVLRDAKLHSLLSDEGRLEDTAYHRPARNEPAGS
jgi:hypothetical protein